MRIRNHRLVDADGETFNYHPTPNRGGTLSPRYIVMHFTAGSSAESSIAHFADRNARASAHLVIGRDGSITQMVPFNRVAWHAGVSAWQGLSGLNRHTIGIELDNAGELDNRAAGWTSWFGRVYPEEDVVVAQHRNGGGESGWHRYTAEQLQSAFDASQAIFDHYNLEDILGHDDIAPERKRDPGPAFNMESFSARLVGRVEDENPVFETITRLNIREEDHHRATLLPEAPLAAGQRVALLSRSGVWCFVEVLGDDDLPYATGWVHGRYIRRV